MKENVAYYTKKTRTKFIIRHQLPVDLEKEGQEN
jgi:hypothetical protein